MYASLESSLQSLEWQSKALWVTQFAMATIGCGLDQVAWPKVRSLIKNVFQHSKIWFTAFLWQPKVKSSELKDVLSFLSDPVEKESKNNKKKV